MNAPEQLSAMLTPEQPLEQPLEQAPKPPTLADAPTEPDRLAQKWQTRIERSRKHWQKFHQRWRHNRALVSGYNKAAEPTSAEWNKHRANLIQGTITSVLPGIYARNPEISVSALHGAGGLKLFCRTLEKVTNRQLDRAGLKERAKATVRAALTCSYGVVKVMYQRDLKEDPIIVGRINDTQDNIATVERLMAVVEDPEHQGELEAKVLELQQAVKALREQVEIVAGEGLVIDRLLTENLLLCESVSEFTEYKNAPWMCQVTPMRRSEAEARWKIKLDGARAYCRDSKDLVATTGGGLASGKSGVTEDTEVAILEIWDATTQSVYTMADGCAFWLREPYSPPKVGERWYPFFLLPFQLVDGEFVAPSLVDLTERLQEEHNEARDRFNKHRDLAIPGWVAAGETSQKAIEKFAKSVSVSGFGEITIVDTDGKPLAQVIQPRQHPPIDPAVYDTSAVRSDWEQVTGLQDAARSTIVQPKTATEASIMQQALSGRVSEFRDQTEDFLTEMAVYAGQILVMELTEPQVERIMGPHKVGEVQGPMGPQPVILERSYDWPQLTRDEVFDMVQLKIRAGSTGSPNKLEEQETWGKVLPVIQGLVKDILTIRSQGGDAEPFVAMLRETLRRFDERLELEDFLPKAPLMPAMPGAPGAPGAGPGAVPPGGAVPPIPPDPGAEPPAPDATELPPQAQAMLP